MRTVKSATVVYAFDLVPNCQIADDRYCSCGQHSTYRFQGIEVPVNALSPKNLATSIGYDMVGATFASHHSENVAVVI